MSETSAEERRQAEAAWRRAQMSAFVTRAGRQLDALHDQQPSLSVPSVVRPAVLDPGGEVLDDTAPEDTAFEDTAFEDTAPEDMAPDDEVLEDTAPDDTAFEDTALDDEVLDAPVLADDVLDDPVTVEAVEPEPEVAAEPEPPVVRRPDAATLDWLDDVTGLIAGAVFEVATGRVLAGRSAHRGLAGELVASAIAWVMRSLDVAVGMMGGEATFGPRSAFELSARDARVIVRYLDAEVGLVVVVDQSDPEASDASLLLTLKRALPALGPGLSRWRGPTR